MIHVENLKKVFKSGDDEIAALKSLSFRIEEGEFVAVTGRSGSGKSTLLYQLGALDIPSDGSVKIGGVDIVKLDKKERSEFRLAELGFIFQDYALLPELTALENVLLPLLMRGMTRMEAEAKSIKALEKVGLAERLHNLPSQLSGGQQQRVSIARAIGHDPKIIFADEPTANLDGETSKVVLDIFLELHRQGQTIIMVTHEPEYAALAGRNIQLLDGVIISDERKNSKKGNA